MRIALFLISANFLLAQEKPISIGSFSSLKVRDGINITLISSDQNKLQINGERKEFVTVTNKDGQLKIRMKTKKKLGGFKTNIELYYNSRLDKIDAIEGAFVSSADVIMQPSVFLSARRGGEIDLVLDVQKAEYKATTGGKITSKGVAKVQNIRITTGGVVQAKEVQSEQTEASIAYGGVCDFSASTIAQVKTNFGGYARIHGKPNKLEHTKFLGGSASVVIPPQKDE
jgi:hypothetical protein